MWRAVRLHVPDAPPLLVQRWVQDSYQRLAALRGWAWLRKDTQLSIAASRTVTVGVTLGDATVTSAGLFVAGDAGRQFHVGNFPIYTIASFTNASAVELDQPYAKATDPAASGTVLDAFVTLPVDFGRFELVADVSNQRLIPWWVSLEEIQRIDPTRSVSGHPRLLLPRGVSGFSGTAGRMQYEWWPRPSAAAVYPARYVASADLLGESTVLPGVLRNRIDVLEVGALARAARWPGTPDRPNPYFQLGTAKALREEFDELVLQMDIRDDDLNPDSYSTIPWHTYSTWGLAYDTLSLRETDATLADYY